MVADSERQARRGRGRTWTLAIAIVLILLVSACLAGIQLSSSRATPATPPPPSSLTPAESVTGQGFADSTSATSITTNSFVTANADVVIAAVTVWDSTVVPSISDAAGDTWTSCGASSAISTSSEGTTYAYCFYTSVGTVVSSMSVKSTTSSAVEMSLDVVSFAGMIAITNIGPWAYESGVTMTVTAVAFSTESLVLVGGYVRSSGAVSATGFTEDSGGTDVPQDYPAIFWALGGAGNGTNYVPVTAATATAAALIMLAIMTGSAAEANGASSMTSGPVGVYAHGAVAVCLTTYDTTLSSLSDSIGDSYTAIVSNYVNSYDANLHQYMFEGLASKSASSVTFTADLAAADYAQMEIVVLPSNSSVAAYSGGSSHDTASFQFTLTSSTSPYLGLVCQGIDRYSGALATSPAMTRGMDGYLPPDAFDNIFVGVETSTSLTETFTEVTATDTSTIPTVWQMTPPVPTSVNIAVDGEANGGAISSSTVSATLTTTHPNDLIVVFLSTNQGWVASSGCSDSNSLGWTSRGGLTGEPPSIGEYYAKSANALSADKISCAMYPAGNLSMVAFGVSGANLSAPFDTSSALPAYAEGTKAVPSMTVTTTYSTDLLVSWWAVNGYENYGEPVNLSLFSIMSWANHTDGVGPFGEVAGALVSPGEHPFYWVWGGSGATYSWALMADAIRAQPYYPVTFKEAGLPTGQSWSVTMGSSTLTSSGGTIVFWEKNGTYSYTVNFPYGFTPNPATGKVAVTTVSVQVSVETGYLGTFLEYGLPSGDTWSVYLTCPSLGYFQQLSSNTTAIVFSGLSNCTYSFSITLPTGYNEWSPSSSLTIAGGPASLSIHAIKGTVYSVTFSFATPIGPWSINLSGSIVSSTSSSISIGEGNGSYAYAITMPFGETAVPTKGTVTVDGSGVPVSLGVWYNVDFVEHGLPAGDSWSVAVDVGPGCPAGCPLGSSTGTLISFNLSNAAYTYEVTVPKGLTASPPNGTFQVDGYPEEIPITISSSTTLWWWAPGSVTGGTSSANPSSNQLCLVNPYGAFGYAQSTPNPPTVNSAGNVYFYQGVGSNWCASYQLTDSGGYSMTPAATISKSGQYIATFIWELSFDTSYWMFTDPEVPGSNAGSKGSIEIQANLWDQTTGSYVESSNAVTVVYSWSWLLEFGQNVGATNAYWEVVFSANLNANQTYVPVTSVVAWMYTEATGDAWSVGWTNFLTNGNTAYFAGSQLLYDG